MSRHTLVYRIMRPAILSFCMSLVLHIGTSFDADEADPFFLPSPHNISVHEGDLAVLKCRVANLGPKMVNVVVWRNMKSDYPVTIGETTFSQDDDVSVDHAQMSRDSSTWDLLIKNVKPHHAGQYECQVTASHKIAQHVTLNVIEQSKSRAGTQTLNNKLKAKIKGNTFVNMGSKLHLICNATGALRAPDDVDWFKDGQRIHPSNEIWKGRIEILKHESFEGKYYVSELIVLHSSMADNGHYVCRSSDLAVNSVKVHVLNADVTRQEKDAQSQSIKTEPASAGSMTIAHILPVWTVTIVALICR